VCACLVAVAPPGRRGCSIQGMACIHLLAPACTHPCALLPASDPPHPPSRGPLPRRTLIDCFGIPEHLVAAPIAGDWARYNEADNQGELLGQAW
jgi:hypothetical protein